VAPARPRPFCLLFFSAAIPVASAPRGGRGATTSASGRTLWRDAIRHSDCCSTAGDRRGTQKDVDSQQACRRAGLSVCPASDGPGVHRETGSPSVAQQSTVEAWQHGTISMTPAPLFSLGQKGTDGGKPFAPFAPFAPSICKVSLPLVRVLLMLVAIWPNSFRCCWPRSLPNPSILIRLAPQLLTSTILSPTPPRPSAFSQTSSRLLRHSSARPHLTSARLSSLMLPFS
jgi:hypothetical protein